MIMFNLKKHNSSNNSNLLKSELDVFDINRQSNGRYSIIIGDEQFELNSLAECKQYISEGIKEIKRHLLDSWHDLGHISKIIPGDKGTNEGSMANVIFLNSAKKAFLLSNRFNQLKEINTSIYKIFNVDAANVDENLILDFNSTFLEVKILHYLILSEMYRIKLINAYMKMTKESQSVSGPWANLDLPMKERMWEWEGDGEDEYFESREKARKEQTRYNPENNKMGFFFVWQDLTRDPYSFDDMKTDSPYKSRHMLTIP